MTKKLIDCEAKDCRFPMEDGLFCAELVRDGGSPYCPEHHERCVVKVGAAGIVGK